MRLPDAADFPGLIAVSRHQIASVWPTVRERSYAVGTSELYPIYGGYDESGCRRRLSPKRPPRVTGKLEIARPNERGDPGVASRLLTIQNRRIRRNAMLGL